MRMTTELIRFTQWAKDQPQRRYTALMGLLAAEEGLADSYHRQPAGKAVGVDRTSKVDYGRELKVNLADLSARLKRMGYRPKPSRRVYIPKSSGQGQRPIGIPCFEDRIVEDRLSRILQAIWEPEFRECSYGFRPDRNAHQALSRLEHIITEERTQWLYEADLKNFFGSVSHEHMMRFIEHRIGDSNLLRLIRRFLKAGVMDEGVFSANEQGTPQGNLVSPVLSNIFLHYSAPGQTWCFQRVKFPPRQGVQPPHRESSLGSEEVTNRTKRRQSDERAVTKVKLSNLVKKLSAGRQRSSGWQAPVGSPQMAMVAGDCGGVMSTARSETEAPRDLGDPLRSWSAVHAGRVCRTIWLTPEKGRRCSAKSDSLVVLRARESRVHGEAAKQMKTGLRDTSPAPTEAGV